MIAADYHLHIRSSAAAGILMQLDELRGTPARMPLQPIGAKQVIAALDQAGIRQGLVLSTAYMFGAPDLKISDRYAKVRAENDYIAEQVSAYPDRLRGACSVNPLNDYALDEIRRCSELQNISAFKLHLGNSGVNLKNHPHVVRLQQVFQLLNELQMPVVIHLRTWEEDYGADDVEIFINRVISQAPDISIQVAHMAGWGGYDEATDSALGAFVQAFDDNRLQHGKVTFDLGAVVFLAAAAGDNIELAKSVRKANAMLAVRIREIGAEHVVFASDWPSWPPVSDKTRGIQAYAQMMAEELSLSESELNTIFANQSTLLAARQ